MDTSLFEKRSVEELPGASWEEVEAECAEQECHDTIPCPPPFPVVKPTGASDEVSF